MATMYELTNDYLRLLEMATDDTLDAEAVAGAFEYINEEIEIKAENTAKVLKMLEGETTLIKLEEERLSKRRKAIENNIKSIKYRLYEAMTITGKRKFKTTLFSFNIQNNPAKVVIDDETKVSKKYLIPQAPKIDTAAIKEALQNGAKIKFAHLEQGESLRIR